jgi:hypothetical protein
MRVAVQSQRGGDVEFFTKESMRHERALAGLLKIWMHDTPHEKRGPRNTRKSWKHIEHFRTTMARPGRYEEEAHHKADNALGMDCSSCGFDCVRSRPANFIKGAKKDAYYPKTRHSQQSLARRLASPFFLPAASSYHEILTVAQLDKADTACAEVDATHPGY